MHYLYFFLSNSLTVVLQEAESIHVSILADLSHCLQNPRVLDEDGVYIHLLSLHNVTGLHSPLVSQDLPPSLYVLCIQGHNNQFQTSRGQGAFVNEVLDLKSVPPINKYNFKNHTSS